ncbi:hypothetical protein [Nocardia neocaledoniensis]|uniref:hypothetical protein n=1 Tax=Nocardia neocaledoniensis TaxID=236511 RepID=UPI0024565819|nr:hypothetical protein [Nocardia neocaledoniensis]
MTTLESEVLAALRRPAGRLLYPETIAAILQRPRPEIDQAVASLRAQRLACRAASGQWYARRGGWS